MVLVFQDLAQPVKGQPGVWCIRPVGGGREEHLLLAIF